MSWSEKLTFFKEAFSTSFFTKTDISAKIDEMIVELNVEKLCRDQFTKNYVRADKGNERRN